MKLNCPSCSTLLDIPEAMANKLIACPKCKNKFVASGALQAAEAMKSASRAERSEGYELSDSDYEKKDASVPMPSQLTACPSCGAPWKRGSLECKKCHYNGLLKARIAPKQKQKFQLKIDIQKVYLVLGLAALGYGLYLVIDNWDKIKAAFNDLFPK